MGSSVDAEIAEVIERERQWCLVKGNALLVMAGIPTGVVDAVITDPPYSSGGLTAGDRQRATSTKYLSTGCAHLYPEFTGDNKDQRSWTSWCATWLAECLRVAKPGAPLCMFTDWRQLPSTTDAMQHGGWIWRGIVPWDKLNARPAKGRFRNQCEYVA